MGLFELLTDGAEHVWAFLRATNTIAMPSWVETGKKSVRDCIT